MEARILKIVSDVLGQKTVVDKDFTFEGISSLKMLQIVMALDEEGIEIAIEKVTRIKSVADILKLVDTAKNA